MHILDKIVKHKKQEVAVAKQKTSIKELKESTYYNSPKVDIKHAFQNSSGVIAEFKRKSPSKPYINPDAITRNVVPGYEKAGAAACSILTDHHFFGGTNQDIVDIRDKVSLPLLRKEFIIDEYQIHEAKSIGANIILLITEILTKEEIATFSGLASELGLCTLLEIHTEKQLEKYTDSIDMIGVNNRDLTTFTVDYKNSIELFPYLPHSTIKISESGIHDTDTIHQLKQCGYDGFLIGERFMKKDSPAEACKYFIQDLLNTHVG